MSLPNTRYGKAGVEALLQGTKKIYFLGIGGVNMSSLARMTAALGYTAAGYDRTETKLTEAVAGEGISVFYTLDPGHVDDCDALVYTVAIGEDNPEYLRARARGIPVISRADYLGYIMCAYARRVGVSGMHGKSTTTAMTAAVFEAGGADPTVLSGAELKGIDSPYRPGGRENFVFEACEYKDSFLDFYPTVAVVLNIDLDHLDYFSGIEQIRDSFSRFIGKTGEDGTAVLNFDDPDVRAIAADYPGRVVGFGLAAPDAEFRAVNISYVGRGASFDITRAGAPFAHICLRVTGEHVVRDALAAAAAAAVCGISPAGIEAGLAAFEGAHRRMEFRGRLGGADVYDDYAHHPTEIRSTLSGAAKLGYGRIWCVFQPHTFSRTASLYKEFAAALTAPGVEVILADIYAARETNTWGVTSEQLAGDIPGARYFSSNEQIAAFLRQSVRPGDGVIIMGAGDIYLLFALLGL